jgi:hypothetical protein
MGYIGKDELLRQAQAIPNSYGNYLARIAEEAM